MCTPPEKKIKRLFSIPNDGNFPLSVELA